ncbi:MAG: fibronectin type III domain-containing protein [Gammaproteobacteria bacterium]|nr:fibronectin type III domain-containing protein [Gammaproteobacteria bacterium]
MTPHKSIRTAIAAAGALAFFMSTAPSIAAAPGAPKDVRAAPVIGGAGEIRVTWTAPDNATQTTSYEVRWRPWGLRPGARARNTDTLNVGGVTAHTLTGLRAGAKYKIKVRTLEVGGDASDYAPKRWVIVEAGNPPGAPQNVRA